MLLLLEANIVTMSNWSFVLTPETYAEMKAIVPESHSARSGITLQEKITSFRTKRLANVILVQNSILGVSLTLIALNFSRLAAQLAVSVCT